MTSVVITGSTRGIGLCMALEFLKHGCNVTVSGRASELSCDAAGRLGPYAGRFIYVPCDVQKMEDMKNLWNVSAEAWRNIDVWINNAGRNVPQAAVYDTAEAYVRGAIDTNITGMILGSQVAAKGMLAQKHGAIYSMEGLGSNNMIQPKTILYGTTKCALTYFMKGLALELEGTGVTAGRLSPGMMLTDFITKAADGGVSSIETDERFRRIFNILADRPETVASFFIPRILANKKNGVRIAWMTNAKAAGRFMSAPFTHRKLV